MPVGFNKKKLMIIFGFLALVFTLTIIWVTTREPEISANNTDTAQNYAKNDVNGNDITDIIGSGAGGMATVSSAPIAAKLKPGASTPIGQDSPENAQMAQQAAQELKTAMKAPISSNLLSPQSSGTGGSSSNGRSNASSPYQSQDSGLPKDDQSMTSEKRNFMKTQQADMSSNVLSGTLNNPIAGLVLAMGTKIPAQLDQEINSDLPGQIYGHVARDVYDSRTHSKLLIPAGSNLVGTYDSALAYGQERLLVAWKRVNMPNGQWLDIQGMGGADPVGAGFGDQVDNHYWRIFGATFLTSVLAAGAQLSQPQQSNALQSPGVGQTIGQSAGTQIANTGTMLLQKNINIQPTLHIRAGFEFTVEVNKDIVFPYPYTANASKN